MNWKQGNTGIIQQRNHLIARPGYNPWRQSHLRHDILLARAENNSDNGRDIGVGTALREHDMVRCDVIGKWSRTKNALED
jgi:hypothetical protein